MDLARKEQQRELSAFLEGRPVVATDLFASLIKALHIFGELEVYALKTMVGIASDRMFAYVIQFARAFIDVVIPFKEVYSDNLCFKKISPVPGSDDYNHHIRIYFKEDLNEEVMSYFKLAYLNALK